MDNNLTKNESVDLSDISTPKLEEGPLIGLVILYSLTTFLSLIGNIFVVIVFKKGKRSRTDLRPFLINLAIADLLMAFFCMPFTFADVIFRTWIFAELFCPVVLFIQTLSVAASVFTNMAIGIDRFLVVTFPLRHRFTQQRFKYVIITIWLNSVILASVQFFVGRANYYEPGILRCEEIWPDPRSRRAYTIVLLLCTYIVPLFILTITYSIVGFLLWKRTAPGNRDQYRDFLQWRSKIKVGMICLFLISL